MLDDRSESDEDSTDRQYEEIKKIKMEMQQNQQKPYQMNKKEKQVYLKIALSLRRIEKSQRAFERD